MENYIVSARKYRPATFDSVVGQHSLTTTLKNAIAQGKLAHAYLFCGPRGVGKTTCARIFAKTINCLSLSANGEACDECESCRAFNEQRSYNIHELDAASNNSVDDIRELIEQVQIPPQIGRYKVFIIDEVHMLSTAAFNAFLKTLEEPPAHAIFILATTEKHKILPTILSRCQTYDFNRITVADAAKHLAYVAEKEGVTYEPEALHVIAEKADGGMRDALSIFDQVASFCNGNITYQKVIEDLNVLDYDAYFAMTDTLLKSDIPNVMLQLDSVLAKGFEANYFIGGLASHFRSLLVSRDSQTLPLLDVSGQVRQRYHEQAMRCDPHFIYRALKLCNDCDINYRTARNKRLLVEITLIQVAQTAAGEDDTSCGRRPTRQLNPIFKQAAPATHSTEEKASQSAAQTQSTRTQHETNAQQPAQPASQLLQIAVEKSRQRIVKPAHTISIRTLQSQNTPQGSATHCQSFVQDPTPKNGNGASAPSPANQPASTFTQDDLLYYWLRYANQMPQEQAAMAGRMKNMTPKLNDNWKVEIVVENGMVEHYMHDLQLPIRNFLRENLHNELITLNIRIAEGNEPRRAYSRKEQLDDMLQRSDAFRQLAKNFQLELA